MHVQHDIVARLNIVATETQQCVLCIVGGTCGCQQCNNIECCTELLLWRIFMWPATVKCAQDLV